MALQLINNLPPRSEWTPETFSQRKAVYHTYKDEVYSCFADPLDTTGRRAQPPSLRHDKGIVSFFKWKKVQQLADEIKANEPGYEPYRMKLIQCAIPDDTYFYMDPRFFPLYFEYMEVYNAVYTNSTAYGHGVFVYHVIQGVSHRFFNCRRPDVEGYYSMDDLNAQTGAKGNHRLGVPNSTFVMNKESRYTQTVEALKQQGITRLFVQTDRGTLVHPVIARLFIDYRFKSVDLWKEDMMFNLAFREGRADIIRDVVNKSLSVPFLEKMKSNYGFGEDIYMAIDDRIHVLNAYSDSSEVPYYEMCYDPIAYPPPTIDPFVEEEPIESPELPESPESPESPEGEDEDLPDLAALVVSPPAPVAPVASTTVVAPSVDTEPSRPVNAEPPRLVNVGANEQTFEWKGRRVVYRYLPFGDKELKCAVYVDGELENMYSASSLRQAIQNAGVASKVLDVVTFLASKAYKDKSRWLTSPGHGIEPIPNERQVITIKGGPDTRDTAITKEHVKTFIDWATNSNTFRNEALATQSRLESGDTQLVHEAAAASNHVYGPTFALVDNGEAPTSIVSAPVQESAVDSRMESSSVVVPWANQDGLVLRPREKEALDNLAVAIGAYNIQKRKADESSDQLYMNACKKMKEAESAVVVLNMKERSNLFCNDLMALMSFNDM